MEVLKRLEKSRNFWFLLLILGGFFLLKMPSLFEPYWYGDEGIYQAIGISINHGYLLYTNIWDNKPPLLYLLYAAFSSSQFAIRLASLLFGILTVLVFFFLSRKILKTQKAVFFATAVFAFFFATPFLEGNIANAENFFLLPVTAAMLLILNLFPLQDSVQNTRESIFHLFKQKQKALFTAGVLFGTALMIKAVALFDFATVWLFLFFLTLPEGVNLKLFWQSLRKHFINTLPLLFGFFLPFLFLSLAFLLRGGFWQFLHSAFLYNYNYVSYYNKIFFPEDILVIKSLLLLFFIIFLLRKKSKLLSSHLFLFLWIGFAFYNLFFSQRPYAHYALVTLPALSLLIGLFSETRREYLRRIFLAVIVFAVLSIGVLTRPDLRISFGYYPNFLLFLTHFKSVSSYRAFFDPHTNRNYEIARYLKSHTKPFSKVFIWGEAAQIYKMSQTLPATRYTVSYHVLYNKKAIKEVKESLKREKPQYIVVVSGSGPVPDSMYNYTYRLTIEDAVIYEKVF